MLTLHSSDMAVKAGRNMLLSISHLTNNTSGQSSINLDICHLPFLATRYQSSCYINILALHCNYIIFVFNILELHYIYTNYIVVTLYSYL